MAESSNQVSFRMLQPALYQRLAELAATNGDKSVGDCARRLVVQALEDHLSGDVRLLQQQVDRANSELIQLRREFRETIRMLVGDLYQNHPDGLDWFKKTFGG